MSASAILAGYLKPLLWSQGRFLLRLLCVVVLSLVGLCQPMLSMHPRLLSNP